MLHERVRLRGCLALGALALLCAPTAAQARPVPSRQEPCSLSLQVDGKEVVLRIEGDEVVATEGGEPLAAERIEKSHGRITIKDADGVPVVQVLTFGNGVQLTRVPRSNRAAIGVETGPLPQGLADHLGLDPGEVIYVNRSIEGRAAHAAGVRDHDVILEIDGQKPVSEAGLRQLLRKKKPGDEIAMRVLRRGAEHELKFRCERARNGLPGIHGTWAYPSPSGRTWSLGYATDDGAQAARILDRVQKDLGKQGQSWSEETRKLVQREIEQALGEVGKQETQLRATIPGAAQDNRYLFPGLPGGTVLQLDGDRDLVLVDPMTGRTTTPTAGGRQLADRIADLEKRFDAFEKMLEKLSQRARGDEPDTKIR